MCKTEGIIMNEGREALPEIPGPFGDQKKNYSNVELKNRYKSISEKETSDFVKSKGNKNTSRKTDGHMKVFIDCLVTSATKIEKFTKLKRRN